MEMNIITDPIQLVQLFSDWDKLSNRVADCHLSQTYEWGIYAWETVASARSRKLSCLVAYDGDHELVLVWPFTIGKSKIWRIAFPLGSETSEYCEPLVIDDARKCNILAEAWNFLTATMPVDVIQLPQLRLNSSLAQSLLKGPKWKFFSSNPFPSPYVEFKGDWKEYYSKLSKNLRPDTNRKRRRLSEVGHVTSEIITDVSEIKSTLEWMIEEKQRWVKRNAVSNDWLDKAEYKEFLLAITTRPISFGKVVIHALKVDGKVISAKLSAIDRNRIEMFIDVFNPEWSQYSPGRLLLEDQLKEAYDRGLQYDFRIGDEAYKFQWSNSNENYINAKYASTLLGAIFVSFFKAELKVRAIRAQLKLGQKLRKYIPTSVIYQIRRVIK